MIRTILVATDGSEAAEAAVRAAADLVLSLGPQAKLHVAGVVHYADVPGMLAKHPAAAPDLLGEEIAQALETATAIARAAGVAFEVHRLQGEIVESILTCAASVGADMLVAGALGRSRLVRLVLGSIAGKLVRSSPLPVVLVHRQAPEPPQK
jgi:nucleotide-binding universal stress UspA family protein